MMSNLAECHEEAVSKQPLSPSPSRTLTSPSGDSDMFVNNNDNAESRSSIPNGECQTQPKVKARKKLSLNIGDGVVATEALPPPKSSWLLRLFESKLFEMSIAIAYLFKSKEPGVLTYLGNKLFVSIRLRYYFLYCITHLGLNECVSTLHCYFAFWS